MIDNTIRDNNGNSINVYSNNIYAFIDSFINNPVNNIDDIYKLSQGRWSYILMMCNKTLNINNSLKIYSDDNRYFNYDITKVNEILDIYFELCSQYDKMITVSGFCNLVGINRDTLYEWARGDKASSPSSVIYKRLSEKFQDALDDCMFSGKVNPVVGIAFKNNTVWKESQVDALTGGPKKNIMQIAAELGVKQQEQEQKALPDADF